MKREIKFRAWGSNDTYPNGKMTYLEDEDNNFVLNLNGDLICTTQKDTFNYDCCMARISWNGLVIMQYTGLKDKNGVEIYEGDVLKYEYYRDRKTKTSFSEVIEWDEMMEFTGFTIHKNMEMEVIGNIYENPELLNND